MFNVLNQVEFNFIKYKTQYVEQQMFLHKHLDIFIKLK